MEKICFCSPRKRNALRMPINDHLRHSNQASAGTTKSSRSALLDVYKLKLATDLEALD